VLPTQIEVRPWRTGDEALLRAATFSAASLTSRFMVGTRRLPGTYLRHVATVGRDRWDAQVALRDGRLVGWAEYGRWRAYGDEADVAVLVLDAWQRKGVATALVRAMLPRCAAAGVRVLHADVAPENIAARAAAVSLFGRPSFADGMIHFRLALGLAS
jgi:RimJ/RimL family protein N-acetyltransferase